MDYVSTTLSIPLATIGFWIAIAQIRRTRIAAESARDAAQEAKKQASRAGILVLIPQLQHTEQQLERAVSSGSRSLVLEWANSWRWQAGELRGHLHVIEPIDKDLPQLLQDSILATTLARESLMGSAENADLIRPTKRLRQAISDVTNKLGEVKVHYASMFGDEVR